MSSNSRMTSSKGPAEEVSLPPTRIRKDVSTANEGNNKAQGQVRANEQSQQPRTADADQAGIILPEDTLTSSSSDSNLPPSLF